MPPTYYRGCWHVVSRGLFFGYRHSSSPIKEVYNPKTFFPHAALLGQAFAHCPIFPTAASRRSLDRLSVPMWPFTLSGRLLIVDLVGRYLTNYLIRRELTPHRIPPLTPPPCDAVVSCGISTCFQVLSPCPGQIVHALLTRPPLEHAGFLPKLSSCLSPLDLHVLGTPPAFVLSQDQTLMFNPSPLGSPTRLGSPKPLLSCYLVAFLLIEF